MSMLLEIRKLSKHYPGFTLSDISFSLNEGEIMGLIGKNGAGKSTALKSVLNMARPDGGQRLYVRNGLFRTRGRL